MMWILIDSAIFLVGVGLFVWVLTNENRQEIDLGTEGAGGVKNKSLTCKSDSLAYPFFEHDESTSKMLKIVAPMNGERLHAISLQYMLYYDNNELIERSESDNHAAMNLDFANNGLQSDALSANYAKLSDGLRFSLYQTMEQMQEMEKQYFLLEKNEVYDIDKLNQTYSALGMNCEITE